MLQKGTCTEKRQSCTRRGKRKCWVYECKCVRDIHAPPPGHGYLSCYYWLFVTSFPFLPLPVWFTPGSDAKPSSPSLWWAPSPSSSPIVDLAHTPPLHTILTFGSRTYHSSEESSSWKWGHPHIKASKSDSTQPTTSLRLINSQGSPSTQVNLESF